MFIAWFRRFADEPAGGKTEFCFLSSFLFQEMAVLRSDNFQNLRPTSTFSRDNTQECCFLKRKRSLLHQELDSYYCAVAALQHQGLSPISQFSRNVNSCLMSLEYFGEEHQTEYSIYLASPDMDIPQYIF